MKVYEIIEELRSSNSRIHKESVLKKHANNELWKQVVQMAYDPLTQFYVRSIKYIPHVEEIDEDFLQTALVCMLTVSRRELTGGEAIDYLTEQFGHLTPEDYEVVQLILDKDLNCGIQASTINKAYGKNFIKETPYMGAKPYSKKLVEQMFEEGGYAYSEVKMDGRYANVRVTLDGDVSLESRNGKSNYFGNHFDNLVGFAKRMKQNVVLNGELIIEGVDRYTSNGIISSLVKIGEKIQSGKDITKDEAKFQKRYGKTYEEGLSSVCLVVWDYIPLYEYENDPNWRNPRYVRMSSLEEYFKDEQSFDNVKFIEYKNVYSPQEAMEHFQEMLARGEEGTILKYADGTWKDGKPKWQVKMKLEMTTDLQVVGLKPGNRGTKYENTLGSLICKSSCGQVSSDVSGMSDEMRDEIWNDENFVNDVVIVEVKSNGLSQDKDGNYALLHPAFMSIRTDKSVADDLQIIREQDSMAKGLLG
jgi:DNA ligase-1